VFQWTGALPVGMGAKDDRTQDGGFQLRLYHGATPKTETSCYYFWTPANGYRTTEPAATDQLYEDIAFTFKEDVDFLEGQQAMITARPDAPYVDIKHDAARLPARRKIEKMIHAETGGGSAIAAE
jgi:hypothetical protein